MRPEPASPYTGFTQPDARDLSSRIASLWRRWGGPEGPARPGPMVLAEQTGLPAPVTTIGPVARGGGGRGGSGGPGGNGGGGAGGESFAVYRFSTAVSIMDNTLKAGGGGLGGAGPGNAGAAAAAGLVR